MALRLRLGARVIQLPSGSMPTISEWACWLIWRIRVLRYFSGIQSLASMKPPASILALNSASYSGFSTLRGPFGSPSGMLSDCVYMVVSSWVSVAAGRYGQPREIS